MNAIRTGICSFGMSGRLFHAPFIHSHPGFELSAIVERHKEDSRTKYPESRLYRSIEELIADPAIQLVIVNTPVQTHFEYVKTALQAGKDVIVEKPFTVNAQEARVLKDLADSTKRFLSVYQNRRYDGDYRAIREVLNNNWLGDLREVEMRYDRYRPTFSGKIHKEGNLPGAGVLHDIGSHLIDQAIQLFGMPLSLFADLRVFRPGAGANDYFELLLFYTSMVVRIKGSVIVRESCPSYILHGMAGSFLQHRSDMQEQQLLAGIVPTVESWCVGPQSPDGLLHTEINGVIVKRSLTSDPGNYMGYYDDVLMALTTGAPNPVPAEDAVKTMTIIDAAFESSRSRKVISIT